MSESSSPTRARMVLIVLALIGAVLFAMLLGQDPEEVPLATSPTQDSAPKAQQSPDLSVPGERVADTEADGSGENFNAEKMNPHDAGEDWSRDTEEPPGESRRAAESEQEGSPNAAEIDRAIARALAIQAFEAGIGAAQANPGPPPVIAEALRQRPVVPVELEQASRQAKVTPPEILEALREERMTPPDIARAMEEAEARGTSDELRAYMAGETDQFPED